MSTYITKQKTQWKQEHLVPLPYGPLGISKAGTTSHACHLASGSAKSIGLYSQHLMRSSPLSTIWGKPTDCRSVLTLETQPRQLQPNTTNMEDSSKKKSCCRQLM